MYNIQDATYSSSLFFVFRGFLAVFDQAGAILGQRLALRESKVSLQVQVLTKDHCVHKSHSFRDCRVKRRDRGTEASSKDVTVGEVEQGSVSGADTRIPEPGLRAAEEGRDRRDSRVKLKQKRELNRIQTNTHTRVRAAGARYTREPWRWRT